MATLTILLLAGTACGGLAFTTNTSRPPQYEVTHTNNEEGVSSYCQQPSFSDVIKQASKGGGCVHMLSSVNHCVWSVGKDVCLTSGTQCENVTGDSSDTQKGQEHLHPGVWRNLAELLKKEMPQGIEATSHTFRYRRACVFDGGGIVKVGCDVEELTNFTSIPERSAIIFLRPESRSWIVEFSVELSECNRGSMIRGLSYLSDKNLKDVKAPQWLQVEFMHSRHSPLHAYSVLIPGLPGWTSVYETQCRGFKSYNVQVQNVSLWHDTCWRDTRIVATFTTIHLLCASAVITSIAVVVAFFALRLTLEAKALVQVMNTDTH